MNKMKELTISVYTLVALCLCLCVTSFALGLAVYEVRDNKFRTGSIELDLNGGEPIIQAHEFLFEPGMTVEKTFYVRNNSTWSVYYKLYFDDVVGELGDILNVTILNERREKLLFGKLSQLTSQNVPAIEDELGVKETKYMLVQFHYPEAAGNSGQGKSLEFVLSAVAVQTKNNPTKEF